jgi:membrane-bound lytic murein transglycosylase B
VLPPPPRRRLTGPILLTCALAIAVVGILVVVNLANSPTPRQRVEPPFDYPTLDVAPGTAVPFAAPTPGTHVVGRTDLSSRTLQAYVQAAERVRAASPGCGLTWAMLAGVGRVESHHGRFGGSSLGADGRLSPPIIGIPLNGSPGVRAVRDTDAGRLDGDQTWDRAVGPMQFLPATWARWGARAADDGQPPDPQHIDDAALTAGRYLCASGGDVATGRGWWKAVMTYNASVAYARDVFSAADAYGRVAAS